MTTDAKWSDFSSLDSERTLAAAAQLLPKWVALALALAIAWQLARIFWMLMPGSVVGDPIDMAPGQFTTPDNRTSTQPGAFDAQSIANAHLFGEASSESVDAAAPPPEETENLEETRLSLTLKGTIAAIGSDESYAIIADQADDEKVYGVGDSIPGGATLHAVYADRVILNENGDLKALNLPREFADGAPVARRSATRVSRVAAGNNRSIQNVVSQNVTKLADVIRPTPYFVAGQQQGYRVYPGRDRKQFAALGLRPGDLIKDIDGASLSDPQQAMEIFENLGTADSVSVTVERNGQPEVLVLRTSQLNLNDSR
jgi:general secretion pathway protein C